MRQQDHTPVYIISAFNPAHLTQCLTEDENARRHKNLKTILEIVAAGQYREVIGCYNGQEEKSFLVTAEALGKQFAIGLGIKFEQESILYLDNQRNAYLIEVRGHSVTSFPQKHIGTFKGVTEKEAHYANNWTRSGDQYFSVV